MDDGIEQAFGDGSPDLPADFLLFPCSDHASLSMMEGVAMPIIQQQLGHASLATASIYLSHIAPKEVIETMGKREWSP